MDTNIRRGIPIAWMRPLSMPSAVKISLFVLTIHLLTLLPVELLGLQIVQSFTGFLILSFVPGFLVVSYVLNEFTLTSVLYAIGFSVAFSMMIGSIANLLYLSFPIEVVPFTQPTTSLLYVSTSTILSGVIWMISESDITLSIVNQFPDYDVRVILLLLCVPTFAVTGALFINRYAFNGLTLLTIVCVALVPVTVYYFDKCGKYYSATIAAISSALLLQNTIITTYLARGDALVEFDRANDVLQNGFWIPQGTFGSMPRIVGLQPAYSLLMDTNLLWVFKTVHPILFVAVPLITYVIAEEYFSKDTAFLSAVLYIFLPRTYQIIGRNTRTGAAIFFTAFLLLVLLNSDLSSYMKRIFIIVFFVGMMMSHYGISTLVLFGVVVAYSLNIFSKYILENKYISQLWFTSVLLFVILYFVWYTYMTGGVFEFLVGTAYGQISDALFFTEGSTAVRSITISESRGLFGMPPGSYEVMFIGHLLLGIFSSIGISLFYLRYLSHGLPYLQGIQSWLERNVLPNLDDRVLKDSDYIHLAVGMFLLFPLSFGPQILSAGRTYALVMIIIAPLPILVLRSTRFKRVGAKPAIMCLVAFLLVTSGFLSATATHDVSPQPIIDNNRIIEEGSTLEQFALYRAFNPENSINVSNFMLTYLPQDATVQRSQLGKFTSELYDDEDTTPYWEEGEGQRIQFTQLNGSDNDLQGYRYLSEPDMVTGTITQRHVGFIFYKYEPLPSYPNPNKIYTSGQDEIHHG